MLRQRIGARVGIRSVATTPLARDGRDNIFVLRERRATSCLLFRPRSVLSVYSETSASHETVCLPFPYARSFPSRCGTSTPVRFPYLSLSIYLSASVCLFISVHLSHFRGRRISLSVTPRASLPTFLFYKIDRTDETEETHSMGRNVRI